MKAGPRNWAEMKTPTAVARSRVGNQEVVTWLKTE